MARIALLLAAAALAGCVTYKLWTEHGGSQEDAVVQLSYEFGRYESPKVDELAGIEMARERCRDWGYRDAQRKGESRQCTNGLPSDCARWLVIREYRCLEERRR